MKLELATFQFTVAIKNGELVFGTPRIDLLQDNTKEVLVHVPNGEYKWTLSLDIDKAEKNDIK